MHGRDRSREKRKISLLVRNLKYETSPDKVRSIFSKYGDIRDVYLPLDYYTKRPRGFGFVEFYSSEDADVAMREMDGAEIDGNKIEVFTAKRGRSDPYQMKHRDSRHRRSFSRGRRHRSYSSDRSRRRSRSNSRDRRSRSSYRRSRSAERYRNGRSSSSDGHRSDDRDAYSESEHSRKSTSRSRSN